VKLFTKIIILFFITACGKPDTNDGDNSNVDDPNALVSNLHEELENIKSLLQKAVQDSIQKLNNETIDQDFKTQIKSLEQQIIELRNDLKNAKDKVQQIAEDKAVELISDLEESGEVSVEQKKRVFEVVIGDLGNGLEALEEDEKTLEQVCASTQIILGVTELDLQDGTRAEPENTNCVKEALDENEELTGEIVHGPNGDYCPLNEKPEVKAARIAKEEAQAQKRAAKESERTPTKTFAELIAAGRNGLRKIEEKKPKDEQNCDTNKGLVDTLADALSKIRPNIEGQDNEEDDWDDVE
jgi:hypothetical protein